MEISRRLRRALVLAIALLVPLVGLEAGARYLEPELDRRDVARNEWELKLLQLQDVAGCVDVLTFGSSITDAAVNPMVAAAGFAGDTAIYNAALLGIDDSELDRWTALVANEVECVGTVVIEVHPLFGFDALRGDEDALDPARQIDPGPEDDDGADGDGPSDGIIGELRSRIALSRQRDLLRSPTRVRSALESRLLDDAGPKFITASGDPIGPDGQVLRFSDERPDFESDFVLDALEDISFSADPDATEALRRASEFWDERGAEVVWLVLPDDLPEPFDAELRQATAEMVTEIGMDPAELVDLSQLDVGVEGFSDRLHLNEIGSVALSEALAEKLSQR